MREHRVIGGLRGGKIETCSCGVVVYIELESFEAQGKMLDSSLVRWRPCSFTRGGQELAACHNPLWRVDKLERMIRSCFLAGAVLGLDDSPEVVKHGFCAAPERLATVVGEQITPVL